MAVVSALGVTDLVTFVLGTIFIVLLPGPNSLYVLSVAMQKGVRAGYSGAAGVFTGDLVLMFLSATGVAAMLKTTPALFLILKALGALYLAWIGLNMLRACGMLWRHAGDKSECSQGLPHRAAAHTGRPFRKALLVSLLNPKAILFFVSFFIQFVDPTYAYPALTFIVLGGIVQLCSLTYLSVLIVAGHRLSTVFHRRQRLSAILSGSVGILFLGFGVRLASASLN